MTFSAQSLGSLGLLIGGKDRKPFVFSFGQEVKEPPCPVCVWACFLHTSAFFFLFYEPCMCSHCKCVKTALNSILFVHQHSSGT